MSAVSMTFGGLVRALEAERAAVHRTHIRILEVVSSQDELFTVRLDKRLPEQMEGCTVSSSSGVWEATLLSADPEHPLAVMELKPAGSLGAPRQGQTAELLEPDFQLQVRSWASLHDKAGADIPAAFQALAAGRWHGPGLNLEAWIQRDPALRPAQARAVEISGGALGIIWGPPGTGKTFTLGSAVAALSLSDRKVLVLAPTNRALDQAVLAIDDARARMGQPLSRGELLRPGFPQLTALDSRPHLLAWTETLRRRAAEIREIRNDLARTRDLLTVAKLKARLKVLERLRSRELWTLTQNARILAATLTGGTHHPEVKKALQEQNVALVFDEASMVSRYASMPFLEQAPRHMLVFGDLRQLGPICRNSRPEAHNSRFWIQDSLFDLLGATSDQQVEKLEESGRLAMLLEQSRMNSELCQNVSRHFYRDRLVTVGNPPRPPVHPRWPGRALLRVEPASDLPPGSPDGVCRRVDKENRRESSAWITVGLAEQALRNNPSLRVLLLTPFKKQAELLRTLVRAQLSAWPETLAGTVHVSQGSEADLVIFDPVKPHSPWLRGAHGDEVARVFCVAFSRARAQLIVVGGLVEMAPNPWLKALCQQAEGFRPRW